MKRCLFLFLALSLILSSCAPEQLVISRYIKECRELKSDKILYTTDKLDHQDIKTVTSKVVDISYYIQLDKEIKATLYMENGHTIDISVANGLLNDANLVGRKFTWYEKSSVYTIDTVFEKKYDTVYVSNLVCEEKIVKNGEYIVKVYDYATEQRCKITTDKETFDALIEVPAYANIADEYGYTKWRANTKYCIPWETALKFKGFNNLNVVFSKNIYYLKVLE